MFKKVLSLMLVAALLCSLAISFASCGGTDDEIKGMSESPLAIPELTVDFEVPENFKIGFICLHDESSTYDLNFINAVLRYQDALGLKNEQVIIKRNVEETEKCYEAAVDLVGQGCNIIFANSFGHEPYIAQAAEAYPDVQFCHATGVTAASKGLANFHNAFASIFQGRFLAGIAAGLKLNEMIEAGEISAEEAKMGYVGAYTYAEVISGYTSFYLGAKSVCPSVTMDVQFTGSWYDVTAEKNAAEALLARNCVLISQHADSMGAPTACEERNVPNISYNGSTLASCPNTFIVSSKIDWTPYFVLICNAVMNGEEIPVDYTGTISTGSVALTDVNTQAAAAGTQEKINELKALLVAGELNVFDTATFTVNGEALTSYLADVDTDAAYEKDTEVIADGYFNESAFRSAPYFDVRIDGITLVNEKY